MPVPPGHPWSLDIMLAKHASPPGAFYVADGTVAVLFMVPAIMDEIAAGVAGGGLRTVTRWRSLKTKELVSVSALDDVVAGRAEQESAVGPPHDASCTIVRAESGDMATLNSNSWLLLKQARSTGASTIGVTWIDDDDVYNQLVGG